MASPITVRSVYDYDVVHVVLFPSGLASPRAPPSHLGSTQNGQAASSEAAASQMLPVSSIAVALVSMTLRVVMCRTPPSPC